MELNIKDATSKYDKWWSSLTIFQKERIAKKISKESGDDDADVTYPACTDLWNKLTLRKKITIYYHCTDKHGYLLKEWKEGQSMSY